MSYILDALKRADAKRSNELLPSGSATATRVVFADTQPYKNSLPWPWIAAVFALLLAGFVAWHFWPQAQAPLGTPSAATLPIAAAPVPATAVVIAPATPAIADRAPLQAQPAAAASAATPAAATAAGSATGPQASVPVRAGTPTAAAADNRIYSQEELPANVRAELPKLVITGSAYSDNPAHRMLIVNGQVVREKDEAASGVVLEQIQPKGAVLRYKGLRYLLPY